MPRESPYSRKSAATAARSSAPDAGSIVNGGAVMARDYNRRRMRVVGMTRREFLRAAAGAASAAPMVNRGRYRLFAQPARTYSARAIELVGRSTVIDMLSPF